MKKLDLELVKKMFSLPQETHPERIYALRHLNVIYDLGCGKNKTIGNAIGVDILGDSDIVGSIDNLPMIEDDSADVIISRHSLEHIGDTVKTLTEWKRILKPGGKIIIILPDDEFIDTMNPILSAGFHLHAFTRDSFRKKVEEISGLSVEKLETVVPGWSFGGVIKKDL
jgi:predicted SAM-dependent methyltransferase